MDNSEVWATEQDEYNAGFGRGCMFGMFIGAIYMFILMTILRMVF